MDHKKYARLLCEAEMNQRQIGRITDVEPDMTVADAYAIQLENVKRRVENGEKVIGMKIGLTSQGMQKLLNVDLPDYGHLFDNMLLTEGQPCKAAELIQPKVEGELSFVIGKTLKGPGVTVTDVYNATDYVVPSIEIVDSRIKDWKIKLEDTIADNGEVCHRRTDQTGRSGGYASDRHDTGKKRCAGQQRRGGGGVGQSRSSGCLSGKHACRF